ncbi:uncharacterized protein E0L32_002584 [Thyridium curvatum]|uniref:Uncharacterized protein n=1 Tax=Thyridium curvatum TaxID=1093900 RepID=A0A507BFP4_9PEZI|nr:uncharacterized protein E0L32_002584 [Thyridium curvatum]TPX18727.1 hypothetical protein E0L32_002584 [Thyridium curvatum]
MGNDGGSIPTRRELVKEGKRAPTVSELKATALESQTHAWSTCPLSAEPLDLDNAVSDWRGRLYAYESVLKGLMPGSGDDDTAEKSHAGAAQISFASTGIRSLRDVVKLKFKRAAGKSGGNGNGHRDDVWVCPVSMKELGPNTKSVYIVPCGHVFAEIAIKEISDNEHICPECSEAFEADNVIPILPTDKVEKERLERRIEGLKAKGQTHSLKKDKNGDKKKKKRSADDAAKGENGAALPKETKKNNGDVRLSGINNPMTASLTAKVLAEQDERNKRRKLAAAS